jgi:cytochrome c-type biogenesis protein CcmH/NrfG
MCQVCGEMFDNTNGICPSCGTPYQVKAGGRSASDLFAEAMDRIRAGQVIDAKGLLSEAIKMDEGNAEYRFFLGSALYKLQDFEGAYSAWQKADRIMPNNERILKGMVAARQRVSEKDNKKK